jgi:hypothetical protein
MILRNTASRVITSASHADCVYGRRRSARAPDSLQQLTLKKRGSPNFWRRRSAAQAQRESKGLCQGASILLQARAHRAGCFVMSAKFRVKRSATGLGLFATEPIDKNCFIVRYWGKRISSRSAGQLKSRYLFELNRRWTIDGSDRRNLARYLNHSCKPNAVATIIDGRIEISAKKKIAIGEEITINYGSDDFNTFIQPSGCKCEACVPQRKT